MSDDLQYEDFDDVLRPGEDELEPIDLDSLDDEIEPQDTIVEPVLEALDLDALDDEIEPVEQQDKATETILEAISELDDEIEDQSAEKIEETIQEAALVETAPEVVESAPEVKEPEAAPEIIEVESEVVEAVTPESVVEPEAVAESEAVVEPEVVAEPEAISEPEKAPPKKRKRKPKVEEETIEEVTAAESSQEAAAEAKAPGDETALLYRVMIPLPEQLAGTVLDLRKTGEIAEMPPPGIDLAAAFHAADLGPVQDALSTWARNHLPLQLELTAVLAEVIGTRQYVAAWMLQPEEELHDAQRDLMRALESFISPLPDAPAAFHVRVTIGDHVTPKPFPSLIGRMQRDFEPFVWDAETVSLIRFGQGEAANQWETVESFR